MPVNLPKKRILCYLLFNLLFIKHISCVVKRTIVDEVECQEVRNLCNRLSENDDLLILECLLSSQPDKFVIINDDCQHKIWSHVREIISDKNVRDSLNLPCKDDLMNIPCNNDGNYLKCVVDNINKIQNWKCNQAILRLESVAFTDYKFVTNFLKSCSDDIESFKCGRFESHNLSQRSTVNCLQDNILNVKDECKKEVFHLSELQSESIKLDNQLYKDCNNDYLHYCTQLSPDTGRVISCLMSRFMANPNDIESKCKQHLMRRQRLITQDFRVSKGLIKACKDDIKRTKCRKQLSLDKTVRLAQILLCLENEKKNSTKLSTDCDKEIIEHRKMLMKDYRLSPEIVNNCKNETSTYCSGYEYGGKTIHCLMSHAVINTNSVEPRLSENCVRALEDLMKETDAGENWKVDPILHQACDPVVKISCRDVPPGNSQVMSCLMDNLRSDVMTEECENALIEIEYFVARDFKLDPQLYSACKNDASNVCHYFGDSTEGPSYSREVLPCLYRYSYGDKLRKQCYQQILRVMRQRALRVDLHPEIEEVCVRDLGAYCKNKVKKGEEMQCLQAHLDDLDDKCHEAVESFTELEAEHVELNPFITKYCGKIIENLCNANGDLSSEMDVMDCLIENKNNPMVKINPGCRASIEHFQLISLKDIRFTYKFKVACKPHVIRLCQNRAGSKSEVIECLSEHILNATVHGVKSNIPKDCRQALRSQIFQQREKIDYDPGLKMACKNDVQKFCSNVQKENAQVLECLQTVPKKDLTQKCGEKIFKIQKQEVYDNSVDYALQIMCAEAIDQFCPHYDRETVFNCLKMNKDEKGFNLKCRAIVMHRIIEQHSNSLLNPTLQQNCQMDIRKYCKNELMKSDEKGIEDNIMSCLERQFKLSKLTNQCERELAEILQEKTLNINLNFAVKNACKKELDTVCNFNGEDSGRIEECLKVSFINKNLATPECRKEVANMIQESEADIHVDPMLQRACTWDLMTFCNHIEQGNGRHIQCLRDILDSSTQKLSTSCKSKFEERLKMYKDVAQIFPPENLQQIYDQVTASPAKNFFVIVIFMMVGVTFFIGVFCGRISRKKYRLLKNK